MTRYNIPYFDASDLAFDSVRKMQGLNSNKNCANPHPRVVSSNQSVQKGFTTPAPAFYQEIGVDYVG